MIGRVLDARFRIDALLGEGGLGQVYRGTHLRLNRSVAIKVMHAQHLKKGELRTRFDREARSLAALSHPNVVGVIDYGLDGEAPFLVMDFLEGRTLEAAIQDGLPADRVVPIFRDVLRAVAYAHGVGLVHRDLKPANVFLQRVPEIGEVVRVLDFGLAKFVDGEGAHASVTRAGMVIGTPAYMSPEQATASLVDARADVYSLGVVLFEMITGQRPFTGSDGAEVLRMHLLQPLPKMSAIAPSSPLSKLLEPVVLRATEKSKADRYIDASEMAAGLDAISAGVEGRASSPAMPSPPKRPSIDKTKMDSIHVTISDVPVSIATFAASRSSAVRSPSSPIVGAIVLGGITLLALAYVFGSRPSAPDSASVGAPLPSVAPPSSITVLPTTVAFVPPPSSAVIVPPSSAVPPPPSPVAVATPNPWAEPIPPQLASIETRIREEHEISRAQRDQLFRFASNHPRDPRGLLLLGHAEVIAHAYTDACHRYQHAYDVNHDARFDPSMQHDLVFAATQPTSSAEAGRMVRAIYGAEALPFIAEVETELAGDARGLARLSRLRESIAAP